MFSFMRSATLNVFLPLNSTYKSNMPPLPAVLVLGDFWIHVCLMNGGDMASYVKASID